ncbi:hypothetical protein [Flavobacterium sp.]|uniref:hypothetical protein n=1 Tax=Flavobacterium sp. TaxID=239 RepID=UPI0025B83296|nr:hypothetical protein [Flavobacterium sp.]MBA4155797.1 hypothetical protein [Flavobacterium sp.]
MFGIKQLPATQDENPFTVEWLTKNLKFSEGDIKSVDELGIQYFVKFSNPEAALRFRDIMKPLQAYPMLCPDGLEVGIMKSSKNNIINAKNNNFTGGSGTSPFFEAANVPRSLVIPCKQEVLPVKILPLSELSLFKLSAQPNRNKNKFIDEKIKGIIPNPFNLEWFSEFLGLDKNTVISTKFDTDCMQYSLIFSSLEHAENFYKVLKAIDSVTPQICEFSNTVQLSFCTQYHILRSVNQSDRNLAPWNEQFFATYLELNLEQIHKIETNMCGIVIVFKDNADAHQYYKKLEAKGIYANHPRGGELPINNTNKSRILKVAFAQLKENPQPTNTSFSFS